MTVGALEILFVLFIVLLIIGPRRIVNLGRSLGRGVRDFRLEFGKKDQELNSGEDSDEQPPEKKS